MTFLLKKIKKYITPKFDPPLGPLFGVFEGGGGVKIGEIGGVDRGVDFYFFF